MTRLPHNKPLQLTRNSAFQLRFGSILASKLVAGSTSAALSSSVTLTTDSDVETRSIDNPKSEKIAKARARNPASCHIPIDSIEIKVRPLRADIALIRGASSLPVSAITVPSSCGRVVSCR